MKGDFMWPQGDGTLCEYCSIGLKRQSVGSNVLYYCKKCGRITSKKDGSVVGADHGVVGICV
jgi:tRNA(Ile2) C34 agmatinyltransferase TiaS